MLTEWIRNFGIAVVITLWLGAGAYLFSKGVIEQRLSYVAAGIFTAILFLVTVGTILGHSTP